MSRELQRPFQNTPFVRFTSPLVGEVKWGFEMVSYIYKQLDASHWDSLTQYIKDGRLDIDYNACERATRPFAVGRKNWMFMGNQPGAKAAAVIYNLIETCKALVKLVVWSHMPICLMS